jgi:hypothetical protein
MLKTFLVRQLWRVVDECLLRIWRPVDLVDNAIEIVFKVMLAPTATIGSTDGRITPSSMKLLA